MRHALLLALALVTSGTAAARELTFGGVTAVFPDAWTMQLDQATPSGHVFLYEVPFPETANTPHIAQAALSVGDNENGESAASFAERKLAGERGEPGFEILATSTDSDSSRTTLWTDTDQGVRYAIIDRFAVTKKLRIHVRLTFPMLEGAPHAWYDKTAREFSEVLKSLQPAGPGAELRLTRGELRLEPQEKGGHGLLVYADKKK